MFNGLYRGAVHDINDPENRGRIRALVPAALGEAVSGWAEPVLPTAANTLWRVEDRVWVMFEGGDLNRPVYLSRMQVEREDLAGDAVDPDLIVTEPGASPTPTVRPSIGQVYIDVVPDPTTLDVTYDLYMSSTDATVPIVPGNLLKSFKGTSTPVDKDIAGNVLSPSTTYHFRIVSRNSAGTKPAGGVGSGTRRRVDTPDISVEAAWVGTMTVDRLVGGNLTAKTSITSGGEITATGPNGEEVSLRGTGFTVKGPTALNNPTYVEFPTTGAPNIIGGTLQANSFSVSGAASFRSVTQLEPGASFIINDRVVAPLAPPIVENVVERAVPTVHTNWPSNAPVASSVWGGAWYNDEYYFVRQSTSTDTTPMVRRVFKYNPTTNTMSYVAALTPPPSVGNVYLQGLVRTSQGWRALWWHIQSASLSLVAYSDTWELGIVRAFGPTVNTNKGLAIGSDDNGDLWIATSTGTSGYLVLKAYNPDLSNLVTPLETVNTTQNFSFDYIHSLTIGTFDMGGARKFLISYGTGSNFFLHILNNVGSDFSNVWNPMGGNAYPFLVYWDNRAAPTGQRFRDISIVSNTVLYSHKYNNPYVTAGTGAPEITRHFGFTFFKAGATTPQDQETILSPQVAASLNNRWRWKATVATPASGLTARVYVGSVTGATNAKLQDTLTTGAIATDPKTTISTTGAAPPATPTFLGDVPGFIGTQQTVNRVISDATFNIGSNVVTSPSGLLGKQFVGKTIVAGSFSSVLTEWTSNSSMKMADTHPFGGVQSSTISVPKAEIRGDGYARLTELERVILSSTQDASAAAGNEPALRIGSVTGSHLRIDGDEIVAMVGDSTQRADGLKVNRINIGTAYGGVFFDGVNHDFPNVPTGSFTANVNMNVGTSNRLRLISSSERFKENIHDADLDLGQILSLRTRLFQRNDERDDETGEILPVTEDSTWYAGFVAEEAHDLGLTGWVDYDSEGKPFGFAYSNWSVALHAVAQDHDRRLAALEGHR